MINYDPTLPVISIIGKWEFDEVGDSFLCLCPNQKLSGCYSSWEGIIKQGKKINLNIVVIEINNMAQKQSEWKHHSYADGSEGTNPDNSPIYQGAELLVNTVTKEVADSWYVAETQQNKKTNANQ